MPANYATISVKIAFVCFSLLLAERNGTAAPPQDQPAESTRRNPSPSEQEQFNRIAREFFQADSKHVLVVAHRGGFRGDPPNLAPENSLPNLDKAVRLGYDIFETDIARTKDGQFVIMHDPTIDRTTTGSGRVSEKTLKQLKSLYLKYPSGKVSTHRIPTLEELLLASRDRIFLKFDIKCDEKYLPHILQKLYETGTLRQTLIRLPWNEQQARDLKQHLRKNKFVSDAMFLFRVNNAQEATAAFQLMQPPMIEIANPQHQLTPEVKKTIARIRSHGARVEMHGWMKPEELQPFIDLEVRAWHSFLPRATLKYLKQTNQHF